MFRKKNNNKILIISHNAISAGTSTQTINFITHLIEHENLKEYHFIIPRIKNFMQIPQDKNENIVLHYIPYKMGFIGYFMRIFIEIFYLPYIIFTIKPSSIFALTNYFFIPGVKAKKVVLLRHPYILENLNSSLLFKDKFIEFFRDFFFTYTLKLVDLVIVQSEHMKKLFFAKYKDFNKEVIVLPNPINTKKFKVNDVKHKSFVEREDLVIYPSRYYPHKNHEFLIALVKKYYTFFIDKKIQFIITLEKDKETKHLFEQIEEHKLNGVIMNIGEVSQSELSDLYKRCKVLFFPSKAETFGNALVEGLFFQIPIVAPNLPYAKAICSNAGSYYDNENIDQAYKRIIQLLSNNSEWENKSNLAFVQREKFLDIYQWTKKVKEILSE